MYLSHKRSGPVRPDDLPESFTQEEAALLLRISVRTLRRFSRDGTIPHRRIGSRYLYSKNRLLQWLAADDEKTHHRKEHI